MGPSPRSGFLATRCSNGSTGRVARNYSLELLPKKHMSRHLDEPFTMVPDSAIDDLSLDGFELRAWVVLHRFAKPDNSTSPSYSTIARYGRMSRPKAVEAISGLIHKGWITKSYQYFEGGSGHRYNQYHLLPSKQHEPGSKPGLPGSKQSGPGLVNRADQVVTPVNQSSKQGELLLKDRIIREENSASEPAAASPDSNPFEDCDGAYESPPTNEANNAPVDAPPKYSAEHLELATYLADSIETEDPKYFAGKPREKTVASWADSFRLLEGRDRRTPAEVWPVLRWARSDDFWKGNILSAHKFRTQFPALLVQMKGRNGNGSRAGGEPMSALDRDEARAIREEQAEQETGYSKVPF